MGQTSGAQFRPLISQSFTYQYLMNIVSLETREDLAWLMATHGPDTTGAAIVLLYGNEDCPNKVEVYAENDVNCHPVVWIQDRENPLGKMVRATVARPAPVESWENKLASSFIDGMSAAR